MNMKNSILIALISCVVLITSVSALVPPTADFMVRYTSQQDPTTVTVNTAVQFTDLSWGQIDSWRYQVKPHGDRYWGSNGTYGYYATKNAKLVFYREGSYDVKLTVTNAAGSNTVLKENMITVVPAMDLPVAKFKTNTQTIRVNHVVWFQDQSTGHIDNWIYIVKPSGSTTGYYATPNAGVRFYKPGTYSVTLQVSNPAGMTQLTKTNYIRVLP